jgi:hypothetical protein
MSTRTIAVDFDGVIHQYSQGWQDGTIYDPPMPGAAEGLLALMNQYAVFIHTTRESKPVAHWVAERLRIPTAYETRCPHENDGDVIAIEAWSKNQGAIYKCGLPVFWNDTSRILVTNRKLPAVAYVDDRAYPFTNWRLAMATLLTPAVPETGVDAP